MSDKRLTTDEVVRAYLDIALVPPEKAPRTQRDARDNDMLILGFNRAQETLRTLLATYGADDATRALADVRNDKQRRPMKVGDTNVWVAA
jgi:hypothetical protein